MPEHNPLALAKTVATAAFLSGGRVILAVEIGWLAEEFRVVGISFERGGQRTHEYIEAMRRFWLMIEAVIAANSCASRTREVIQIT